jgi:hypothetical protein
MKWLPLLQTWLNQAPKDRPFRKDLGETGIMAAA